MEQLQPALGPPGMREQAAHQDFYGNLLLETAASAAAAKGLPAAGAAAAAAAAAAAPRPLPTPRRRTRIASPRATRTVACRGLQAGERSRGGSVGLGRRSGGVGSPDGGGGCRETLPVPRLLAGLLRGTRARRAPSSCGYALAPGLRRKQSRVSLAVCPRPPASGSGGDFLASLPCFGSA